jgi:hypothetical protein
MFAVALAHGIFAGTDTTVEAVRMLYWVTGATLVFLTIYRILATKFAPKKPVRAA